MLEIFGYIVAGLVLVIGAILLVASRKPDHFSYARSARINASPEKLFGMINDLREMNRWNPYALRETNGKAEYSGAASGPGQRFDFAGSKSGTGHVEILESQAPTSVAMRLAMVKPIKVDNRIDFTIAPAASGTQVTWAMSGPQPLLGKVMMMFIDCDKMMGRDFDEGLSNMKRLAEAPAAEASHAA